MESCQKRVGVVTDRPFLPLTEAPDVLPVFPPTGQTTASQDATGATEMLHGPLTCPVEQTLQCLIPVLLTSRLRTLIWTKTVSLPPLPGPQMKRVRCLTRSLLNQRTVIRKLMKSRHIVKPSGVSGGNKYLSLSPQPVH